MLLRDGMGEGETLEARLRRTGPLPVPEAIEILEQVTRALAAAEAQGIVHRDLKPANLMLTRCPELVVKVIDFGLAKAVVAADETDLTYGAFVGTPVFASPEQFTGSGVDVRSDLYSLGATLWMMLTARTPFTGSPAEVMYQHQHARLPLEQLEGLPKPVIILLEKDPSRRFQSPAELLKTIPTIRAAVDARRRITRQSLQRRPRAASGAVTRKGPGKSGPKKVSIARLPITGSD